MARTYRGKNKSTPKPTKRTSGTGLLRGSACRTDSDCGPSCSCSQNGCECEEEPGVGAGMPQSTQPVQAMLPAGPVGPGWYARQSRLTYTRGRNPRLVGKKSPALTLSAKQALARGAYKR